MSPALSSLFLLSHYKIPFLPLQVIFKNSLGKGYIISWGNALGVKGPMARINIFIYVYQVCIKTRKVSILCVIIDSHYCWRTHYWEHHCIGRLFSSNHKYSIVYTILLAEYVLANGKEKSLETVHNKFIVYKRSELGILPLFQCVHKKSKTVNWY